MPIMSKLDVKAVDMFLADMFRHCIVLGASLQKWILYRHLAEQYICDTQNYIPLACF